MAPIFIVEAISLINQPKGNCMKIVYDGALLCHTANCCPIVEYDEARGTVTIRDPHKPENGAFTMTKEEYNTLLANATPLTL